jgi:hypothetical protein
MIGCGVNKKYLIAKASSLSKIFVVTDEDRPPLLGLRPRGDLECLESEYFSVKLI